MPDHSKEIGAEGAGGHPLDNVIWQALKTVQKDLAEGKGLARRYPVSMAPLRRREIAAAAVQSLFSVVAPGERIALFTTEEIEPQPPFSVIRRALVEQMGSSGRPLEPTAAVTVELGEHDVRAMLALTAATEPGPFGRETIRMGHYRGIKSTFGELLSMAGERLRLRGFTEVSGVCTTAQARGNGYARALVLAIASMILNDGVTPFLHVKTENGAKRLYEQIGFRVRKQIWLTVMTRT